jgi:hypothetical protein
MAGRAALAPDAGGQGDSSPLDAAAGKGLPAAADEVPF